MPGDQGENVHVHAVSVISINTVIVKVCTLRCIYIQVDVPLLGPVSQSSAPLHHSCSLWGYFSVGVGINDEDRTRV
jgi:hypothetical protein